MSKLIEFKQNTTKWWMDQRKKKKLLKLKENKTQYTKPLGTLKEVLRGKFRSLSSYIKKSERISNLRMCHKNLEKSRKIKIINRWRKDIGKNPTCLHIKSPRASWTIRNILQHYQGWIWWSYSQSFQLEKLEAIRFKSRLRQGCSLHSLFFNIRKIERIQIRTEVKW